MYSNEFNYPLMSEFYRQKPGGPGRPPQGPGGVNRPPTGPPPSFTPQRPQAASNAQILAVDPGSIRPCRFRFVYIWPERGRPFWMFITFVGPRSIAGWRWTGFSWSYFGIDLNRIDSFVCF
ncbi:hypothetical protein [Clostridium tetani]|uniref:hypothetical protein n=1 Tax=Clostridium tetani TaxID=1513 RepID=UPI00100AD9C9|nr:hypothetical protein [Clostridium tetani]RXM57763.1 hypothetical protein DP133_08440 [Clostridium tetani]RXM75528.1 hypothetical protein DP154_09205 [Clostridium tetani]RYU98771.1 hypothetical protein DP144_09210 [Clostridium tetani]